MIVSVLLTGCKQEATEAEATQTTAPAEAKTEEAVATEEAVVDPYAEHMDQYMDCL